jgi:hypothetical protein
MAVHNVFISHRHEDDGLLAPLRQMLAERGCWLRDSSITADKPNRAEDEHYIKSMLARRIRWAGAVIVIVSPQTWKHEWVDWEIEYASKHRTKRIIGLWAPGEARCALPAPLAEHADAVVAWNATAIIEAIEGPVRAR